MEGPGILLRFFFFFGLMFCMLGKERVLADPHTLFVAASAWALGVFSNLSKPELLLAAGFVFLVAALMGLSWRGAYSWRTKPASPPAELILIASAAFLVGAGSLLAASLAGSAGLILEAKQFWKPQGSRSLSRNLAVSVRAQNLRGVLGRIEGALERSGLCPKLLELKANQEEKEIKVTFLLQSPLRTSLNELAHQLSELEGVLQVVFD